MSRCLRALIALVALAGLGLGVSTAPDGAGAASSRQHSTSAKHKHKHKKKKKLSPPPKPVTIAPGVRVTYYNVAIPAGRKKRVVRSALLRFTMTDPHISLDASVPNFALGAGRQTILAQAVARRAVGGINADFFDVGSPTGEPRGGLIVGGALMKTPRRGWDANFYVRHGRAHIGRADFTASVTRAARPATETPDPTDPSAPPVITEASPATTRAVSSVNDFRDLAADRIVLVTSAVAAPRFGRTCSVAVGTTNGPTLTGGVANGSGVISAVYPAIRSLARRPVNGFALAACGTGPRAAWLRDKIAVGDTVTTSTTFHDGMPRTLVSGGRVLVEHGHAFHDSDGKTITGRNPETFGCVSASGKDVLLGTIDGRREGSSGVTLRELTGYLLRLHCYSGIVFDGGGSSTLVGQPAGTSRVVVLNRPSDRGGARKVTTGLVLYRR